MAQSFAPRREQRTLELGRRNTAIPSPEGLWAQVEVDCGKHAWPHRQRGEEPLLQKGSKKPQTL